MRQQRRVVATLPVVAVDRAKERVVRIRRVALLNQLRRNGVLVARIVTGPARSVVSEKVKSKKVLTEFGGLFENNYPRL
jgi:hypothetical protein